MPTKIDWCDEVWNPITGCTKGCPYCYARGFAKRMQKHPNAKITHQYRNAFSPTCHPERLCLPLTWKKPRPLPDPIGTVTGIDHHSLVTANMIRHFGESVGSSPAAPTGTVMADGLGKTGLVTSNLIKLRGTCRDGQQVDQPLHTISSQGQHFGEVRAFLMQYHGMSESHDLREPINTVTSRDRFGLVAVKGELYEIADIGMRMLAPRELFRAQGFREDYIIDRDADGRPISKTEQVAKCGNSVWPPVAEAVIRANMLQAAGRECAA
jgi:hypothetical protein